MVLNYIWIAFFLLAAVCAIIQCFIGNTGVFADIVGSTFENAKTAFEISIGLTGVLSLCSQKHSVHSSHASFPVFPRGIQPPGISS